jgi:hypothetical protein
MNQKLEDQFQPIVEKFVAEQLKGRYREHVSDAFLVALLMRELSQPVSNHRPELSRAAAIVAGDGRGEAYTAACYIFENILEYQRCAGGNGHHVAQNFNACFDHFTKE